MKLVYGQTERKFTVAWTDPSGSDMSVSFTTRGDLFNFVRALRKAGYKDTDLNMQSVVRTQLALEGE